MKDSTIRLKKAHSTASKIAYVTGFQTFSDSRRRCFVQFAERRCMGFREKLPDGQLGSYKWLTFREIGKLVKKIGATLQLLFPKVIACCA